MSRKVVLGLSGGVDSAVAALLLKQQGYDVQCVYLVCWHEPGCRAEQDRKDAMKVALQLDLSFQVLDFKKEYKARVMEYFYEEYKAGRTPNPDVLCNKEIKFGLFYDWAISNGYDYVATGHYASISPVLSSRTGSAACLDPGSSEQQVDSMESTNKSKDPVSRLAVGYGMTNERVYHLLTATDLKKDQSYFLYRIRLDQLPHILFPIGHLLKSEVRKLAKENDLVVFDKKDSMGICFVGDVNVRAMLKERYGTKSGEVQLSDGTVIGEHDGYWFFTIGQRGGWTFKVKSQKLKVKSEGSSVIPHLANSQDAGSHLGLSLSNLPPLYVVDINKEDNVIVVGTREEGMRSGFDLTDIHWINPKYHLLNTKYCVRIRNTGDFIPVWISETDSGLTVKLEKPEFGVAAGQSAVIYQKNSKIKHDEYVVLGGGIIE